MDTNEDRVNDEDLENTKEEITEKCKTGSSNGIGCLGYVIAIGGLVVTLSLGPFDFTRTVYNQLVGDTQVLKRKLVDYNRRTLSNKYPLSTQNRDTAIEKKLAERLDVEYDGKGKIDPLEVSIHRLWDEVEEHPKNRKDQWLWTKLD
ncbi:hypothetical protein GOV12_02925 [Candidatus Pacearchaeota archaeon]|nr:hypothetical protein [Candidatus Pacearchaeota archaeon]